MKLRYVLSISLWCMGGILLGMLAGGLWSSVVGQPFSGRTGLSVIPTGMIFPGLVLMAPIGAVVGFSIGLVRSATKRDRE